jgi:hypothetical protein
MSSNRTTQFFADITTYGNSDSATVFSSFHVTFGPTVIYSFFAA